MITIFKIFEKQRLPKKGDYVILNLGSSTQEMKEFTKNNIGKIITNRILTYNSRWFDKYIYKIEYDLLTYEDKKIFNDFYRIFSIKNEINKFKVDHSEIEYWSENKEDVERYLKIKKYNL